ncbi:hypothetical protein PAXRUDRAFT_821272 [Paxillus rubicundulus Ve08.2h10]|uniref:Uncharacterized protein n=1 Tax=Paxillus rubicundulus Ve08.2h10 TaxID=930991 RepID=A0A0D0E6S2_9AGAM|nr:hypothetical protein PAXRUDRAFT_821272 [Paxillus rubicundulus Ve08.2h10]
MTVILRAHNQYGVKFICIFAQRAHARAGDEKDVPDLCRHAVSCICVDTTLPRLVHILERSGLRMRSHWHCHRR